MAENKKGGNEVWKDVGWFALKTAAISGAVLGGVAIAVPAMGFTAGGIAAGSLAASFQSAFLGGTIASGSAFAVLQSVGAAGLAASTQGAVVAASATAAGAHTAIKKLKKKLKDKKNKKNPSEHKNTDDLESSEEENEETLVEIEENGVRYTFRYRNNLPFGKLSFKKESEVTDCLEGFDNDKVVFQPTDPPSLIEKSDEMLKLESAWREVELSDDITLTTSLIKKKFLK